MNRLIRAILYISAGCLGIGCAALVIGLMFGGGKGLGSDAALSGRVHDIVQEVRRRIEGHHSVDAKDPWELEEAIAIEDDGSTYIMEGNGGISDRIVQEYDVEDKIDDDPGVQGVLSVEASSIQSMEIVLYHASLSIEESDSSQIHVSVEGQADGVTAKCESGKITIQDGRKGRKKRKEVQVYVEMPQGKQFKDILIQADAGVLESDCEFAAKNLTVNADAGDISISDVQADVFAVSVGTGIVEIDDGYFKKVNMDCGVGTIDANIDIQSDSQVSCGMGTVDIELENGIDSVNYELSCGAGGISVGDRDYGGFSGGQRIDNGASATLVLECGMGQISID